MDVLPDIWDSCGCDLLDANSNGDKNWCEIIPVVGGWHPAAILPGRILGRGRAAQARLVEAAGVDGTRIEVVEKNFCPGLLTKAVYRVAFQAPFAYEQSRDAIVACFYRRRVAAALVRAMLPSVRVAEPLYVRRDRVTDSWVLGAEFIRGRGIRPAPADPFMLRRWIARLLRRQCKSPPREEINDLLEAMSKLESLFRDSGLVGSGWQVCPRALVSTANLLRTEDGYVVVDLESGIPAMLVGYYVVAALRIGSLPLFDDVDAPRLKTWLASRRQCIESRLGSDGYASICQDAQRLIVHTQQWKESEPAVLRNRAAVASRAFYRKFKNRIVDTWRCRNIIDQRAAERIRADRRFYSRPTFLVGLIPGRAGRFLQRCIAHRQYRRQVARFCGEKVYRRAVLRKAVDETTKNWHDAGRLSPDRHFPGTNALFIVHLVLSVVTPASVHRWLTDRRRRRAVAIRLLLLGVSSRFQRAHGRRLLHQMIHRWKREGRLETFEAESLRRQLRANELDEYVRCLGMHLGLKLLTPLVEPLKVGGVVATVATGNPLYLLPFLAMPLCRTAITVWRMLGSTRRHIRYLEALLVGTLPIIGTLAYAVQMRSSHQGLSELFIRDAASRAGRWLPIYGGTDSRVEIWFIKATNLVLEVMDLLQGLTRLFHRRFVKERAATQIESQLATIPFDRSQGTPRRACAVAPDPVNPEFVLRHEERDIAFTNNRKARAA